MLMLCPGFERREESKEVKVEKAGCSEHGK
jgi:hypothetical protein